MNLTELQSHLAKQIPMLDLLGLQLINYDNLQLQVDLPLGNNINEKGTMLGGSLSSAALLSGWIFSYLTFDGLDKQISVVSSECQFNAPIKQDCRLVVSVSENEQQRALQNFALKQKTAFQLEIVIYNDKTLQKNAMKMSAVYVVSQNELHK